MAKPRKNPKMRLKPVSTVKRGNAAAAARQGTTHSAGSAISGPKVK